MADRVETTPAPNSTILATRVDPTSSRYEANMRFMADLMSQVHNEEEKIREGGAAKAVESQHSKGRLTARERIGLLADPGTFFERGVCAANFADRSHNGDVRGGRRISAGDVRSRPNDGRQRTFPGWAGAGAGGDWAENFRRRAGRRGDAFSHQRHGRFSRAE